MPCTPNASRASSYLNFGLTTATMKKQTTEERSPMQTAPRTLTVPAAGVMATSPATAPVHTPTVVGFCCAPSRSASTSSPPRKWPSASPEKRWPRYRRPQTASGIETEPAEPQKSRSHEYESNVVRAHRLSDPVASSLTEQHGHYQCGNTGIDMHDRSAAKSMAPISCSHPPPHTQCAIGLYTKMLHRIVKSIKPENLIRSAKAPSIKAGSDHGKHTLENHENDFGNVARSQRRRRYAVQHHFIETADHACLRQSRKERFRIRNCNRMPPTEY